MRTPFLKTLRSGLASLAAAALLAAPATAATAGADNAGADLSITKTVSNASPAIGERIEFTVTLTNSGEASNLVKVLDQFNDGAGCVETIGQPQFSHGNWIGTPDEGFRWTGTMAAGQTMTATQAARVTCVTQFSNKASVISSGSNPDSDTVGHEAEVWVWPVPSTDVEVVKTVSHTDPVVGQRMSFHLTVTNHGPAVQGIVIRDVLADPSGCFQRINQPEVSRGYAQVGDFKTTTWVLDLGAGESATFRQFGWVACATTFTNEATVESGGSLPDLTPANNRSMVIVRPSQGKTIDLEVIKVVDNSYPLEGDIVTFTITLSNNTESEDGRTFPTNVARDIQVKDYLPHGLTLVDHSVQLGTFDESTTTWHLEELNPGKATSLSIRARVEAEGEYTNCAEVWDADMKDRDSTTGEEAGGPLAGAKRQDDEDCVSLWAGPLLVDLEVQKVVDNDRPIQGDIITYSVTVRNRAVEQGRDIPTADATNITIADYLQPGQHYVDGSATVGGPNGITFNPHNTSWHIESLRAGKALTLVFQAEMVNAGEYSNCAEVHAADPRDRDSRTAVEAGGPLAYGHESEDDQDCVTVWVTPRRPDLELVKHVSNENPRVGDYVTYSITVTNRMFEQGVEIPTASATNVVIKDYFSNRLWFEDGSATDSSVPGQPGGITFDQSAFTWTIDEIRPGKSVTVSFRARVDDDGEIRNCAEVWDADQGDRDSRSGAEAYGKLVGGPDAEDDQDCVSIFVDQLPEPKGSVSAFVFLDADVDGVFNHYDTGLGGFEVDLTTIGEDRTCGTFDDVEVASLDSDKSGNVTFWDVETGEYCLRILDITVPAGYFRTTAARVPVWVSRGAHVTGIEFGFRESYPSYPQAPSDDPLCYLTGNREVSTFAPGALSDVRLAGLSDDVAAVAYSPWSETLFATDGEALGTVDALTGAFQRLGYIGSGEGEVGPQRFESVTGLTFDPFQGRLFGIVAREDAADLVIEIDPETGTAVRGAFGPRNDYLLVGGDLPQVDDIAINPVDGGLYAVGTADGMSARMARIDRTFGTVNEVRDLGTARLNGLSFFNNGELFASTATDVPLLINLDIGVDISITIEATLGQGAYGSAGNGVGYTDPGAPQAPGHNSGYDPGSGSGGSNGGSGYGSGLDCLTGRVNALGTMLFADDNGDGQYQTGESGFAGVGVDLFRDINANGTLDQGDVLVAQSQTGDDGQVVFETAANGDFLMQVVSSTLPFGAHTSAAGPVAGTVGGFGLSATDTGVPVTGALSTSSEDEPVSELPGEYALDGNYPNPFNPQTTVSFKLPESGDVRLAVYDILGREVALLHQGSLSAGTHEVTFRADAMPSGTYFARMVTKAGVFTRSMILIK
ncbi:MAG: DUF11 domain-containing protein [Rhodothermales bacterium]|nr:DUF11 domain-containing protein [Rhodothermales bacterium]MBO6778410.1 DUF11 domain-containing protein [Rhodothermales bacterium]